MIPQLVTQLKGLSREQNLMICRMTGPALNAAYPKLCLIKYKERKEKMKKVSLLGIMTSGVLLFGIVLVGLNKSYAHCDTLNGPVVKDAEIALEKGDVTPVLKWVKKDAEPEIRAAFNTALAERAKGKEAREKADMKFFENLVRVHRAGEGESFTGLKPADAVEPIIAEADKVLETGSVDTLTTEMSKLLTNEVKERFDRAFEKRKHKDESVEAGREYVEAYVEYVHYVEGIHTAISEKGAHHHKEAEQTKQEAHGMK
jgi:hypothetical protein